MKSFHFMSLGLGLAMAVALVGCQGKSDSLVSNSGSGTSSGSGETNSGDSNSGDGSTDGGSTDTSDLSIAFVTNQIADFWKIAEAGCLDAEKDLGIKVEVRMPPEATAVRQQSIVEDLIVGGVDGIAISPLDAENQLDWINSVGDRVTLITQDSDAPGANRLLYIGMDNYEAGRMCGRLVKEALPEGGEVMLFIGRLEQDNSKFRRQGVIDELMDRDRDLAYYRNEPDAFDPEEPISNDKYTVLGTMLDQGKNDEAQRNAEDCISTYENLGAMVGLFEYNPPACYQAIAKAEKLGEIKLIGFDENNVTLQAIKDGYCTGTIVQDPYQYGYQSVRILKALLTDDRSVLDNGDYYDVPARSITAENVDEYWEDLRAKTAG
ncbi:MAG: sugar-binding protein [Planctomycetales bacterium]|nr:sugar-binding protein [Planctomycetales bacterium]